MRLRSILRKRRGLEGRGRGIDHQRWPDCYFKKLGLFYLLDAREAEFASLRNGVNYGLSVADALFGFADVVASLVEVDDVGSEHGGDLSRNPALSEVLRDEIRTAVFERIKSYTVSWISG